MTKFLWRIVILIAVVLILAIWSQDGFGEELGIASWYSTKESKGRMANGETFDDKKYTCASWNYRFGTMLKVVNLTNDRSVEVRVTDRGPGQPKCSCLKKPQKIIDLSKAAFKKLAPLRVGLLKVRVEQIK